MPDDVDDLDGLGRAFLPTVNRRVVRRRGHWRRTRSGALIYVSPVFTVDTQPGRWQWENIPADTDP